MPEGRCDIILLGWTAFVGLNLLADFLWSGNGRPVADASGGAVGASFGMSSSELYRGEYQLMRNGTLVQTGTIRLTLAVAAQQISVKDVQVLTMSMALVQKGARSSVTSLDSSFPFSGIQFGDAGKPRTLTATGTSNPRFPAFGPASCHLDAAVDLGGPKDSHVSSKDQADAGPADYEISGEVAAVECGYHLVFTAKAVDIIYFTQKVAHYSIWVNLLTILQIRFFLTQMRYTEDGPSAAKVSIVCIAMQALMDAYDSFLHLCLGLSSQYMFNTIAVVSLFKFILFSLLEARYLLAIWRQRHHEAFNQGWAAMRRELSWLYSRFYGVLIVGLVLIYNNLDHLDSIALFFHAFWIPQILFDAWQGSRSALRPVFFVGIAVTRTLFVLYLWGCPSGIFSGDLYPPLPGAPSASMCTSVAALQGIQVAFMLAQQKLGPRWFVPWVCMPWAYNYHRQVRLEPGSDCVICMSEIDPEDARRVVTPCNHKFHRACLEQWMDVKMECPTCRTTLPPIQ